jgi:hypothetical protein
VGNPGLAVTADYTHFKFSEAVSSLVQIAEVLPRLEQEAAEALERPNCAEPGATVRHCYI